MPGQDIKKAEEAIWDQIHLLLDKGLEKDELTKVQNKVEASLVYADMSVLNKAMNLSMFELLDDADMINHEVEKYRAVTEASFMINAKNVLRKENCSTLHYLKNKA
jgi:hypothetical protein